MDCAFCAQPIDRGPGCWVAVVTKITDAVGESRLYGHDACWRRVLADSVHPTMRESVSKHWHP